jgi:seryl-tRNA synthetase
MNNELTKQFLESSARLAAASEALEQALARLDAQHNDLSTKIDRMVAAVDDTAERKTLEERVSDLLSKKEELEKQNAELKAQATRASFSANMRKTLSPMVSALLAKNGLEGDKFEVSALDKILAPLSVEQRIAVKGEMARAGVIS